MEAHLIPDIFKVDILWVQGPEEFWVQMPEYEQHWPNGAGCVEEPQLCSAEWLKSQTFIPGANVKRGQYCEVFWPKKKRWCRARVDAICQGMRNKTSCFLLDYNRSITVSSPSLQPPGEAFLHPVIRYKCSLGDVKPVGLLYDPLQDVVCLRPAEQWNMAARHYFKEAVEGSSLTHVQVLGLQNQTFNVRLFLGLSGDDKQLSVSYELVQRMFAFYLNKCLSHRCLILRGKTLEYGPPNSFGVYGSEKSLPASVSTLENGHTDDDYQHLSDLMKGEQWLPKMCATMVTKQKFEDVGTLSNGWSKENIKLDHVVACPDKDASKLPVVEAPTRPHTPLPLIHPNELAQFDLFSTHHLDCDPIKIDVGGKNTEVLESEFHKIYEDVEMRSEEDPAEQCLVNFMTPLACRLLQLLDPDPLNLERKHFMKQLLVEESKDAVNPPHVLVHARHRLKEIDSLQCAPFLPEVKQAMIRNGFLKPNDFLAQCWTAVLAGIDLLAVSANCSNDTSSFLPPLLTWLVNPAAYAALPGGNGPLAAVVCAGWATASRVHSQLLLLLESLSGVRVLLLSLATGRNPEQLALLFEGVEVVVCSVDVLEDLSRCGHVPLSRLCHLVFFEACNLLARLPQQMEMVVSSFERVVSLREARGVHAPHQCILLAQQWTPALADLTKRLCVHEPYMVFADWLQAALYGGVSLDVHICHEEKRSEELRQFITSQDQQVQINGLIFANDNLQARQLHEELCSFDLPCLLALEPEEQQQAQLQWASEHNSSMIMIVTDDSSLRLDVSNATMVIHYTFPDSFNVLSQRLACLRDNFDSMIPGNDRIGKAKPSSLLLLSEECMAKAVGLLSHLVLAGITLPNSLQQLISAGSATHSEDRKHRPLCTNVKTFGICWSGMACRDRHSLIAEKGSHLNTRLALGSTVTVYVTSILDAARFLGCVESNSEVDLSDRELDREQVATSSLRITGKMSVFFAQHSPVMPKRVKLGCLYAFRQNGEVFSRVRVCGLPQAKAMGHGWPVPICFVDEGRLGWARLEHLAELPLHLSVLQPLCTEVVLCRLCPADRGFTWPPRAMQYMAEKLVGTKLKGRVVLALGNTLWLDPLVFLNVLPGTRMQTVEFSARGLLLTSGLAVPAPEHLTHLALLCKQAGLPGPFISGMQKESVSKPGSPTTRTEIADQETKCPKYEVIQETGLSLPVIVSAFDSPLLFYIQKKELLPRLDELHDKLNELGGVEMKQDETVSLQKQDLCLAQFPLDKKWYRGKLIEPVNETTWEVLFLDYGDTTNVPLVQIKPLPSQFLNLPFQAVRCSLFSINLPDRCFTESHSDSLWQNLHLKTYVATLISVSENGDGRQHFVELEENGISLASQLVRCGMAQPSSVALPRLFEVKETNNTSSPDDICELCAMLYLLLGCDKGSLKRLQATAALQIWADTIEPSNGNLSLAQWWRALMATANLLPYLTAPEELTAVVTALVLALRKCLDEDEKLLHRNFLDKAIVALCFVLDKAECVTARVPALTALTHLTAQKNHEQYSLKLLASACQQLHGGDPFSTPYDACIILAGLPDSCEPLLAEVLLNTNSVSSLCALLETASLPVAIHRAACQVIMKTAKHSDCICGKLQQTGGVNTIFHFVSVSHNSQAVKLALMALKQLFTRVEDLVPTFEEQARATVARFLPLNLDILQIMMECNQKSLWNIPVDLSQIKIRCCPEVLWHQQTDKIILTVMICEAKDFLFDIEEDCVTLSACSANICYTLKLQLFAPVREAKSTCCIRTLHITISLEKQHPASWPRLLENSRIHRNIHCNIESLSDSTCRRLPAFSGKKTEGKAPSERNSDLWDSASESNTSATSSENMIALVNPLLPL